MSLPIASDAERRMVVAPKHATALRPLVLGSLAFVIIGTMIGTLALLHIHLALGPVAVAWLQIHGQQQLFGFLLPFVMGFASYLFPRLAAGRPLRRWRTLLWSGGFMLTACETILGQMLATGAVRKDLLHFSACLVATGCCSAAWALSGPLAELRRRRGHAHGRGYEAMLEFALLLLAAAGITDGVGLWLAGSTPGWTIPLGLAAAAERLGIQGFAVGTAIAVSARMFPGFLGVDPRRARPQAWLVTTWVLAEALGAAGAITASSRLTLVADSLFALAVIPMAFRLGLGRSRGGPAIDRSQDPFFPWGARPAYALLVLAAVVRPVVDLAEQLGFPVNGLWWDAARHVLVIGFLMTLIAAMAGRLAPGFAGRRLAFPPLRAFACLGFAGAALLRTAEAFAGQWGPPQLLWVSAMSGPLAAAAFLALAICLGITLLRGRTTPSARRDQEQATRPLASGPNGADWSR